jgi:hypothetical protein
VSIIALRGELVKRACMGFRLHLIIICHNEERSDEVISNN